MTLDLLVQEILDTHHALLHRELPRLDAALATAPVPLREPWTALSQLLREHMGKEEGILFPAIQALVSGGPAHGCGVDGPIRQMHFEHGQIASLVETINLHSALAGDEQGALEALLADLVVHARKEDQRLFPAAQALALGEAMRDRIARIERDHAHLGSGFATLAAALEGADCPRRFEERFQEFHDLLIAHLAEEDAALLPAMRKLATGEPPPTSGFEAVLAGMQTEAAEVEAFAEGIYRIADQAGPHEDTLKGLLDDLQAHASYEEQTFFPTAMRLLEVWDPEAAHGPSPIEAPVGSSRFVLRRTRSPCVTCLELLDAEVAVYEDRVVLERTCPTHGPSEQLLSRSPGYWVDLDKYFFKVNPGAWPQRDFIVRMTEKCNRDCPICLARANDSDAVDLDIGALEKLLNELRGGGLKIDLMAAEPTLREDLEDVVRKIKAAGHIAALHSNGLKLAHLPFARKMADAGVDVFPPTVHR